MLTCSKTRLSHSFSLLHVSNFRKNHEEKSEIIVDKKTVDRSGNIINSEIDVANKKNEESSAPI